MKVKVENNSHKSELATARAVAPDDRNTTSRPIRNTLHVFTERQPNYSLVLASLFCFLLVLGISQRTYSGAFHAAETEGADTVVHPMYYTGIEVNQVIEITVGIDPASENGIDMQFPVLNAVALVPKLYLGTNGSTTSGTSAFPSTTWEREWNEEQLGNEDGRLPFLLNRSRNELCVTHHSS